MVTQAAKFSSVILPVFLAWLLLWFNWLPFGYEVNDEWRHLIQIFPLYVVLLLGCYSLASVGLGVAQFNDCSEAAESLREEIIEAKTDLRRRGMQL